MQHFKQAFWGYMFCLIVFGGTGAIANPPSRLDTQPEQGVSRLTYILEDVAEELGYRSMRGIRIPDQWAEGEKQGWLVDHAFTTLFGKDSDNSCLSMNGRIEATILSFKDREMAERQLATIKQNHAKNIGFKVIREDHEGYLVEEGNGLYAAVISKADVLLLEDRSRMQGQTIEAMANAVVRKTR